jgi:pSer/pThr/pTyr-binding forkhead associated (FHA) protein
MPEPLLAVLKVCALALLYLFFVRVLRAVWAEVGPVRMATGIAPTPARSKASRRPRGTAGNRLVVVEPKDRKGQTFDLADELTIGRAPNCAITLDDNYTSQLHARIFRRDGTVHVEDLGSTNGTYLNGRKVAGAVPVKRGDRVKVGTTVLEADV